MARRLVSDDQKMFRVVVIARQRRDNPKWERGNLASPRFLWDGPEYTTAYGPFPTLGGARGQLTFRTVDVNGTPLDGVVSGRIEQGHTTWAPVDERGPAATPSDRLARIAEAHAKYVAFGGLTSGECRECGESWPCPTYAWATTDRDPLATWDPADDEPTEG